jgi:hypothetical protein
MEYAKLVQIKLGAKQEAVSGAKTVTVQFNPATLRLSYSNQNKGGDQPGGVGTQFLGRGTTRLSVELFFDTSESGDDVRRKSEELAFFLRPDESVRDANRRAPPGVRFEWGAFLFKGVVQSMDETLDYFSEGGRPLRATISLTLQQQDIRIEFGRAGAEAGPGGGPGGVPGADPMEPARPDDTLQRMAARAGDSAGWKAIAEANNIDDPLRLAAGQLLNVRGALG